MQPQGSKETAVFDSGMRGSEKPKDRPNVGVPSPVEDKYKALYDSGLRGEEKPREAHLKPEARGKPEGLPNLPTGTVKLAEDADSITVKIPKTKK